MVSAKMAEAPRRYAEEVLINTRCALRIETSRKHRAPSSAITGLPCQRMSSISLHTWPAGSRFAKLI